MRGESEVTHGGWGWGGGEIMFKARGMDTCIQTDVREEQLLRKQLGGPPALTCPSEKEQPAKKIKEEKSQVNKVTEEGLVSPKQVSEARSDQVFGMLLRSRR